MKQSLKNLNNIDASVIIVSFNTEKLTLQCIKSVISSINNLDYEIIVVDNGSTDNTLKLIQNLNLNIREDKSKIIIISNNENLGFSKANNQGIKIAKGKYILLLNSDTKVKEGFLEKLFEFAEKSPDAGVVAPRLLNPDNTIQPSAFRFPTIGRAIKQYWLGNKNLLDKYIPISNEQLLVTVESIVMAAFLITPKALKGVGLLNEKYFMYFEDLDYCRRVGKTGLKIYYLSNAEVIHYHGASGKNLAEGKNQWRRLIPGSKIYHGTFNHYLFSFILWSGQKLQKILHH